MKLDDFLHTLRRSKDIAPLTTAWRTLPARPALFEPLPPGLDPRLADMLTAQGIRQPYTHQAEAIEQVLLGANVVVVTPTASGKTLCYNLPVLHSLIENRDACALYLFPTKALAHDQLETLTHSIEYLQLQVVAAAYDGDTPRSRRSAIRRNARVVVSNPDMLHIGILPNHIGWREFLSHLRYIVIDEMHAYRGIFGSHVANVIRRLKRLCSFYGSHPQFICCSATIANPAQLATRIVEEPVALVMQNGAPRGQRHMVFINPPVTDERLGLRRPALHQARDLAGMLLQAGVQTVVFVRSRRAVERLILALRRDARRRGFQPESIRGYRAGYLPHERRAIEAGLRSGEVRLVVATNALELGVDIGGMAACVMVGYPGTIASTWQQAGRAGRGLETSVAFMIASDSPLDQYIVTHPDYVLGRSHEHALINPDNLHLLLSHIPCAVTELPFETNETFGNEDTQEILRYLQENGVVRHAGDRWFVTGGQSPAADISLRSADPHNVSVVTCDAAGQQVIGHLERSSAPMWVHQGAIYMHEGGQYSVSGLDWEAGIAQVEPVVVDYFTQASVSTRISIQRVFEKSEYLDITLSLGEVLLTRKATRYRKLRLGTLEHLGWGQIDLPEQQVLASGCWLVLQTDLIERLRQEGWWTGEQVESRGPNWPQQRDLARARDNSRCRQCGAVERAGRQHDVHHVRPFREFNWSPGQNDNYLQANHLENLITLCTACHRQAEGQVAVQSTLSGVARVLGHVIPLLLMCDPRDVSLHSELKSPEMKRPTLYVTESIPGGVGLSDQVYNLFDELLAQAIELVSDCSCQNGCPSCVGAAATGLPRAKKQVLRLLREIRDARGVTRGPPAQGV